MLNQGGCIVVRVDSETGKVRVLLIQSLTNRKQWVVPKGGIEFGETPEQAAVRETREETGFTGELGPFLGTFFDSKKSATVHLFVLFVKDQESHFDEKGLRKIKWVSLKKAIGTEKSLQKGKKVLVDRDFVTQGLTQLRHLLQSGLIVWPEWSPQPRIKQNASSKLGGGGSSNSNNDDEGNSSPDSE